MSTYSLFVQETLWVINATAGGDVCSQPDDKRVLAAPEKRKTETAGEDGGVDQIRRTTVRCASRESDVNTDAYRARDASARTPPSTLPFRQSA